MKLKHSPEPWNEWREEIKDAIMALPELPPASLSPWGEWRTDEAALEAMKDWESGFMLDLQLAIQSVCRGEKPPALKEGPAIALCLRLGWAMDWIDCMRSDAGAALPAPPTEDRPLLLEWILTDLWEIRGRLRTLHERFVEAHYT